MIKKSKGLLGILLNFLIVGAPAYADAGHFIKSSLLIGVGLGALGQAEELFVLDNLSKKCNISKEDIRSILVASIALFGLGCLPIRGEDTRRAIRQLAFRAPFFAGLTGFVSSKLFKNILSKIPHIGTYLGACAEPDCQGSCNKCKIRTAAMTVLLWQSLASRPVTWLENTSVGVRCGLGVAE